MADRYAHLFELDVEALGGETELLAKLKQRYPQRYSELQDRHNGSVTFAGIDFDVDAAIAVDRKAVEARRGGEEADEAGEDGPVENPAEQYPANWTAIGQMDPALIPHTPWLVEALLMFRDITTIAGKGGSGKSLLAWLIGIVVATALALERWPAPKERRRVLVLSGEDDVLEIERRVHVACKPLGIDPADLEDRFLVRQNRGIGLLTKDQRTGEISRTALWHEVRWMIQNMAVGLLIIDPLIASRLGFGESDNDDAKALFEQIRALTEGCDCAVLVVDHFAKGASGDNQDAVRGASAKVDASRVGITVQAMTEKEWKRIRPPGRREDYVQIYDPKMNYARKRGASWWQLVELDVGNGEKRPALVPRSLNQLEGFIDARTWAHREAFLRMVRDGRQDADHKGWPWCSATKGSDDSRLDAAVAERFELTRDQAREWIKAFAAEGSIVEEEWKSPTRNTSTIWRINLDFDPGEDDG